MNAERYVAVIGAVNIDIWGRSAADVILRDSNPGEIRFSPGGVGRNIAHNLVLLGGRVSMLTALGDDLWAESVRRSCIECGVDLSEAVRVPGGRTSGYLYVTGPDGDLTVGLCDTDIAKHISPDFLAGKQDFLDRAELVVFDGNLTEETIAWLTEHCTVPLFADPVSVTKARKLKPWLHRIHTLKPNAQEAEELTGISDPAGAAETLVRLGVKRAFVSAGADGIYAACGAAQYHVPCCPTRLVNVTGGGDAAMAALCRAYQRGWDAETSARFAAAAGSLAAECEETISPLMNEANVLARMHAAAQL